MDNNISLKNKQFLDRISEPYQKIIKDGLDYSWKKLDGRKRLDGTTYHEHSLNVASLVIDLGLDISSILVALLHHVYSEAQKQQKELDLSREIEESFGSEVLDLLTFTYKLSDITNLAAEQELLTKYILKDCEDIRALMIRLSDKIVDARSISFLPMEKQLHFADQMLKVYAPLSDYLNLYSFKKEFEEVAFRLSQPAEYKLIDSHLSEHRSYNEKARHHIVNKLKKVASTTNNSSLVFGRVKSHFSIYRKIRKYQREGRGHDLQEIKDILAFSILEEDIKDCYIVLSEIQADPTIRLQELEDYIVDPKPNGYKALHLLLEMELEDLNDIVIAEVQVMTNEMYHYNTYGAASHFAYKQQGLRFARPSTNFEWVKELRDSVETLTASPETQFSQPIRSSVFKDQVFAFTPKGDIVALPNGATVVDFAYTIHTHIGNHMVRAKVNDKFVGLGTEVKDGDTVSIITSKNPTSRSRVSDIWLEYAQTSRARKKIIKELTNRWK